MEGREYGVTGYFKVHYFEVVETIGSLLLYLFFGDGWTSPMCRLRSFLWTQQYTATVDLNKQCRRIGSDNTNDNHMSFELH